MPYALALPALVCLSSAALGAPLAPEDLRCEYLVNPLAVQTAVPRLSWEVRDEARGARQTAYQVLVASGQERLAAGDADLWDSGKVASDAAAQIEYAGAPLGSGAACWWKVRTWDASDEPSPWSAVASWRVGLLDASDWRAEWIGHPESSPIPKPEHNGYHSALTPNPDEAKWVTLDLGETKRLDAVRLHPARPHNWERDEPGFLFPVRFQVNVSNSGDFSVFETVVDKTAADFANPGDETVEFGFEPREARFVSLLVTKLADRDAGNCAFALAEFEVASDGEVVSTGAVASARDSIDAAGWGLAKLCDGDTASHPGVSAPPAPATVVRKEFGLTGEVLRATAYVTALGLYELRLNGERVGDHILAPEWTDYHKRIQYQAYDVTDLVTSEGPNAIGATLGDGWYAGHIGFLGWGRGVYGTKPQLLLQLDVEFVDGTRTEVVTDGTWRVTPDGPVRSSDIYLGEAHDLRMALQGWDQPGFDDSAWVPAAAEPPGDALLVAQPNEPIRVTQDLPAVTRTEPQPGVFIYDLGQNMVGWPRIQASGDSGAQVRVRHGEMLNPDGTLYTENLRGPLQVDTYVLAGGGPETLEPHFTYHGFRYVEVMGLTTPPEPQDVVGRVFCSSSPEVGSFECSDARVNRLWENILWTQRANLMSTPTDCPQRDERLGWTGDIQAFCQTAMFNMDMAGFFTKWIPDVRDAQGADGRFPDYAPAPYQVAGGGAPAWADAGVVAPWRMYTNYGDTRLLREHYDAMKAWIGYVDSLNPDHLWRNGRNADWNDWLNGDTLILEGYPTTGGEIPKEVFGTAFFAHSAELVSKMAEVLGEDDDARRYAQLAESVREAFVKAYVDADGRILGNTQAGYALALNFDLLPEAMRARALEHLLAEVARYDGRLSTGIQTTHRLMLELSRAGRDDMANEMLSQPAPPSWLYQVDQGATTIWERWDGYVDGRGFQNAGMNSFNHWALGAVGEWLYRTVLGIVPDESAPGWAHFSIAPRPGGGITWAKGAYDSIRGPIAVDWRQEGGAFALDVTIPANTTATVVLPVSDAAVVTESGVALDQADGVGRVRRTERGLEMEVGAGRYWFRAG